MDSRELWHKIDAISNDLNKVRIIADNCAVYPQPQTVTLPDGVILLVKPGYFLPTAYFNNKEVFFDRGTLLEYLETNENQAQVILRDLELAISRMKDEIISAIKLAYQDDGEWAEYLIAPYEIAFEFKPIFDISCAQSNIDTEYDELKNRYASLIIRIAEVVRCLCYHIYKGIVRIEKNEIFEVTQSHGSCTITVKDGIFHVSYAGEKRKRKFESPTHFAYAAMTLWANKDYVTDTITTLNVIRESIAKEVKERQTK